MWFCGTAFGRSVVHGETVDVVGIWRHVSPHVFAVPVLQCVIEISRGGAMVPKLLLTFWTDSVRHVLTTGEIRNAVLCGHHASKVALSSKSVRIHMSRLATTQNASERHCCRCNERQQEATEVGVNLKHFGPWSFSCKFYYFSIRYCAGRVFLT